MKGMSNLTKKEATLPMQIKKKNQKHSQIDCEFNAQ
jgi:hypothetical protein